MNNTTQINGWYRYDTTPVTDGVPCIALVYTKRRKEEKIIKGYWGSDNFYLHGGGELSPVWDIVVWRYEKEQGV